MTETVVLFICVVLSGCHSASGLNLLLCDGSPKAISLQEEQTNQTITCTGVGSTGTIAWSFKFGTYVQVAECPAPSSCTAYNSYIATRDNIVSTLTIRPAPVRSDYTDSDVVCKAGNENVTCPLDLIYPADVSGYQIGVNTLGNTWTLKGSCEITKAFSSRNRYSCLGYLIKEYPTNQVTELNVTKTANILLPGSEPKPYYTFSCTFSVAVPSIAGLYQISFAVYPGLVVNCRRIAARCGGSDRCMPTCVIVVVRVGMFWLAHDYADDRGDDKETHLAVNDSPLAPAGKSGSERKQH